ncbi:MAG TPA: thioredoxin-disulfide reductase [Candidatus Baltobacteraceae bacterium]|nr:thioredoxin-disulfide reductase [Candidatus Baltobacteraceae bacterium]
MENVIIIGAGPAGYTAGIYASRANLEPLLLAGPQPGGQLTTTTDVENWPGEDKGVMGPELVQKLRAQAEKFGTRVVEETVKAVDFSSRPYKILTESGKAYETQTVIVATGASARRLGLESEKALYGKGVSACATCDGFFFKNKEVAVVGGGDSAMEEATFLTKFASKVTILNRTDKYKASVPLLERARSNPKISFIENVDVAEVLGAEEGHVTGLTLKDSKTGETRKLLTDGVFVAIGHMPNTDFLKQWLECDKVGYVVTKGPGDVTTKYEGVFVAGDVMDKRYRQAVTAAGTGCMAALEAERLLTDRSFGASQ